MIKFFRTVRKRMLTENKFSKYFLYAIGEIFLVVIGILIALSINNWNQKDKEKRLIESYANSLIIDLEEDIKSIDDIQSQMVELSIRIDTLANYTRNKSLENLSNLKILMLIIDDNYSPYSWNNATIEELKSSGALRFTGNNDLAKKIVAYDGFKRHMLDDYEADKSLVEINFPVVRSSINMNYSNYNELSRVGRNNIPYFSSESKKEKQYTKNIQKLNNLIVTAENENLELLANNINSINEMVNGYLKLNRNLNTRVKLELPQLKKIAEEIIELLKAKYIN